VHCSDPYTAAATGSRAEPGPNGRSTPTRARSSIRRRVRRSRATRRDGFRLRFRSWRPRPRPFCTLWMPSTSPLMTRPRESEQQHVLPSLLDVGRSGLEYGVHRSTSGARSASRPGRRPCLRSSRPRWMSQRARAAPGASTSARTPPTWATASGTTSSPCTTRTRR
jgi:hypothetical protein